MHLQTILSFFCRKYGRMGTSSIRWIYENIDRLVKTMEDRKASRNTTIQGKAVLEVSGLKKSAPDTTVRTCHQH
jgi:hypothetical protein